MFSLSFAKADPDTLGEMASRYGIHTKRALGVPMREIKALAKRLGTDHEPATELWVTGWYEARPARRKRRRSSKFGLIAMV